MDLDRRALSASGNLDAPAARHTPRARAPARSGARTGASLLCLVLALAQANVHASARALPPSPGATVERSPADSATPRMPEADDPALEALVRSLRASAQTEAPPPPAPRSPPRPPARGSSPPATPGQAAWLLGLFALHGLGMPLEPAQAQQWFERAHTLGHPLAPAGLAWCQISGCVTPPNPVAAERWTAELARSAPALAKYLQWHAAAALSPLSAPPPATPLNPSPGHAPAPQGVPAHTLLAEAARAGSAQAANAWGLELLAAGQLDKALEQFRAGAAQSEAAAANARLLASRIEQASAARQRPARYTASDWYDDARRYHRGEGVPANYAEAVRLYQIAASSGDARARRMLELIFSRPAPGGTVDPAWMQQLASLPVEGQGGVPLQPPTPPAVPQLWQQDPTPLYHLIPPQWRRPR